jgi:anti-sigma factor RsiW
MSDALRRCEWVRDRIEPYLDMEIGGAERAAFESHCAGCASCARELSLAIRIRAEFRSLPAFAVPPRVVEQAARRIESASSNVIPLSAPRRRRRLVFSALAAAALAVAVAAALWSDSARRHDAGYSEAEIRRARASLALAFGLVGRYSDGVVREEVFEKRVVPTIERAVRGDEADVTSRSPQRS